jgi:hypothetical protein
MNWALALLPWFNDPDVQIAGLLVVISLFIVFLIVLTEES